MVIYTKTGKKSRVALLRKRKSPFFFFVRFLLWKFYIIVNDANFWKIKTMFFNIFINFGKNNNNKTFNKVLQCRVTRRVFCQKNMNFDAVHFRIFAKKTNCSSSSIFKSFVTSLVDAHQEDCLVLNLLPTFIFCPKILILRHFCKSQKKKKMNQIQNEPQ